MAAILTKCKDFTLERLKYFGAGFLVFILFTLFYVLPAFAQTSVDDISDNVIDSVNELPFFLAALAYLLGLLIGVTGVLKIREHVENPNNAPLRVGFVRLLTGGALFSLPIIYETLRNSIASIDFFSTFGDTFITLTSGVFGFFSGIPVLGSLINDFNVILASIVESIDQTPAAIAALAYLLGLVIGVQGILKAKDHVENPDQNALKESVVRLLLAGALFSLPTIYDAMYTSIVGDDPSIGAIATSIGGAGGLVASGYANTDCLSGLGSSISSLQSTLGSLGIGSGAGGGAGVGEVMCNTIGHTAAFPAFLTAISYLFGLILGLWGLFKIRDHVLDPQRVSIWEGTTRLGAGGAFFALPIIIEVMRVTLSGGGGGGAAGSIFSSFMGLGNAVTGYNTSGCGASGGLDGILVCFMSDVMGPVHIVLSFFAFCAGVVLIMIGISRLIKSAQDGARGPGGIGTIMTFITGGALISYNELMRAFSVTLIGDPVTRTFAELTYVEGSMTEAEILHATSVVTAIVQFVIIVGLISFVRGIFIIRGVAEGSQQASIMAGLTHIIGGALAVNVGPLLNAVQTTLGIGGFGIAFS